MKNCLSSHGFSTVNTKSKVNAIALAWVQNLKRIVSAFKTQNACSFDFDTKLFDFYAVLSKNCRHCRRWTEASVYAYGQKTAEKCTEMEWTSKMLLLIVIWKATFFMSPSTKHQKHTSDVEVTYHQWCIDSETLRILSRFRNLISS